MIGEKELRLIKLFIENPADFFYEIKARKKLFLVFHNELEKLLAYYEKNAVLDYIISDDILGKELNMEIIQIDNVSFIAFQHILQSLRSENVIKEMKRIAGEITQMRDATEEDLEKIKEKIAALSLADEDWANNSLDEVLEDTIVYLDKIKTLDLIWASFWPMFKQLDQFTWGLEKGKVIRVWGWSNVWKTWLLYAWLLSFLDQGYKCYFFSMENDPSLTMKNLCWLKKGVNSLPQNIKNNNIDFWKELDYFYWLKGKFNLYGPQIDKLETVFAICQREKPDYIFIDYLQLADLSWHWADEKDRLTYYAKSIQKFASKNKIGVVDLSQLSNNTVRGGHKWEGSEEFGGSSALKNATDIGIHLFIDKEKDEARQESDDVLDKFKNPIKVKVSKNRLWPTRIVMDYELDFTEWGKYINYSF